METYGICEECGSDITAIGCDCGAYEPDMARTRNVNEDGGEDR